MNLIDTFNHLDWAQVLQLTWQHIMLVGVAVGLAIIVGVPLGILMTRFPAVAGPLQASATVLLTIPRSPCSACCCRSTPSSARASGRCRRSLRCFSTHCCRSCATPTWP